MRIAMALVALTTAALAAGPEVSQPAAAPPEATPVAFVGVNVVPMDRERIIENQTVVVRGDRIERIGPAAQVEVPAGVRRVDAAGKYLMPGLAEMHGHVPGGAPDDPALQRVLFLYVSNGVTTVRGMLGHPEHLALREALEQGKVFGPRFSTSGPSVNAKSAPTAEVARRMVRDQHAAGYDFMKIHPSVSRKAYDALIAEAHAAGMLFAGHVPAEAGLWRALEAKQSTIDHLDAYVEALAAEGAPEDTGFFGFNVIDHIDESRIPKLARSTKEAGVWNVPTQSLFVDWMAGDPDALEKRPDLRYMPRETVQNWLKAVRNMQGNPAWSRERAERFLDLRSKILRALHEEGAGLLLGSDAPQVFNVPGFSIHQELEWVVKAGLTPFEALATGTREVARYFGTTERHGTVAEGKAADLILLDANPLDDVAHVQRRAGVVMKGHWLPEAEIQKRLEAIATEQMTRR